MHVLQLPRFGRTAESTHPLSTDRETVIGRDRECDVVVPALGVSRRHARIVPRPVSGEWRFEIEDLNSRNGTYVNGIPVDGPVALEHGDKISISTIILTVAAEGRPSEPDDGLSTIKILPPLSDASALDSDPGDLPASGAETAEIVSSAQLRSLLEILHDLGAIRDFSEVLPRVLETLARSVPECAHAQISLLEPDGFLTPHATFSVSREAGFSEQAVNDAAARAVVESGDVLLVSGVEAEPYSVFGEAAASVVAVPVISSGGVVLGAVCLDATDATSPFTETHVQMLTGLAAVLAQAIELRRATAAETELRRRRKQLRTAREIQLRMLPDRPPEIPGYEIAQYHDAADVVGGDCFDYQLLPDGRLVVTLADVAGKGLTAALTAAHLAAEIRHCITSSTSLKLAMRRLNATVFEFGDPLVTFLLCVLDPANHRFTVASAGHYPPLRRHSEDTLVQRVGLERTGLPFGVAPQATYHPTTIRLDPGDVLLLHTDGLNECMNAAQELYGLQRLRDAVGRGPATAGGLLQTVREDLAAHCGSASLSDDTCIICLSRTATV